MRKTLIQQFEKVGLTLKILDKPMGVRGNGTSIRSSIPMANQDIFQLDIKRRREGNRRIEWFEIYPGHIDNVIQILDGDNKNSQLLLLVREPERTYNVVERKRRKQSSVDRRRDELESNKILIEETGDHFIIRRKTPKGNRHFLMGVDERQLFVALLQKGATNIKEAKKQLGSSLMLLEGKRELSSRQGEWFFVKATTEQEELIESLITKNNIVIHKKENIGVHGGRSGGNPHVADELVVLPGRDLLQKMNDKSTYPVRHKEVFVRGCVRHIDHKTVKYTHWQQVILNNEGQTRDSTQSWID